MLNSIAVTGCDGMSGSHIVKLFKEKNIKVIPVGKSAWDLSIWKDDCELDELFANIDTIIHAGAFVSTDDDRLKENFDINVRACCNLAHYCLQKNKKILYLSGSTIYKETEAANIHEDSEKTLFGLGGFYGFSKYLSENIFGHFMAQGLECTMLRASSIYGKGLKKDKFISATIQKCINHEDIILDAPLNKINLIHAMDVANACYLSLKSSITGSFNIASNELASFEQIATLIKSLTNSRSKIVTKNQTNKPVQRFDLDISKAANTFGFSPRIDIKTGLHSIINQDYLEKRFV
jgi:nucleoside-diphosphate-sugar epimerase